VRDKAKATGSTIDRVRVRGERNMCRRADIVAVEGTGMGTATGGVPGEATIRESRVYPTRRTVHPYVHGSCARSCDATSARSMRDLPTFACSRRLVVVLQRRRAGVALAALALPGPAVAGLAEASVTPLTWWLLAGAGLAAVIAAEMGI
jgi:hypothetical protein